MADTEVGGRSPARGWFYVLGVLLLLLGVLGLVPAVVEAFHRIDIHLEGGEDPLHWLLGIVHLGIAYG